MGEIFVTSDLHFCHDKEFLYAPRGFSNVWDMNEVIVENWNNIVGKDDDVYVLGDIMLNDNELGLRLLKELKGNIHIILGNHDTQVRQELYNICYNVVEIAYATLLTYEKQRFYLSHYPCLCGNYDDQKRLTSRTISLCGHTHTNDMWADWDKGLIVHCELDTTDCTPHSMDYILNQVRQKYKLEFSEKI